VTPDVLGRQAVALNPSHQTLRAKLY